jgi:hypothetical protein
LKLLQKEERIFCPLVPETGKYYLMTFCLNLELQN